jgi:hypothetical protein
MKRNDFILLGIILVISITALVYRNVVKQSGDKVIVTVDGMVYREISLNEDISIVIEGVNGGTNELVIQDGHADMVEASCPDKICVHQASIQYNGETIVCLPNKVIIEIKSDKESTLDSVVR